MMIADEKFNGVVLGLVTYWVPKELTIPIHIIMSNGNSYYAEPKDTLKNSTRVRRLCLPIQIITITILIYRKTVRLVLVPTWAS